CENLRLGTEPAIGGAMHDAVAIALERTAVRMFGLGVLSPSGLRTVHGIGRQQGPFANVDGVERCAHRQLILAPWGRAQARSAVAWHDAAAPTARRVPGE